MNRISTSAKISPLADIERSVRGNAVVVGDNVTIDSFVKIKFAGGDGDVHIGDQVYLNSGVVIYSGNGISIGRGTLIAANTTLAPTNHEYRSRDKTIIDQRFMPSKGGIVIEEDCWIGANCVLLDGCVLRRGCVVGAGTVLRGAWPEYAVIGGNPAAVMRYRESVATE
jgi:acetyltransferase-like isoleucine patch superfamily enzyme